MKLEFSILVCLISISFAQPASDKITSLPLWNQPIGNQYSGYIDVSPQTGGRFLHYWFVQSTSNNSMKDPLVLWLNGGPGCSSLDGFFYEHGPIHFVPNGTTYSLIANPFAWTQVANVIYLESPAGVGFSYSSNPNDYKTDDNKTAVDNYNFLKQWLTLFPQYVGNDFWIAGESYAGVYVPTLAARVLAGNANGEFPAKLKGVMVGNGVTNSLSVTDLNGYVSFLAGHGFISMKQYAIVNSTCTANPNGDQCQNLLEQVFGQIDGIDMYDVYGMCFHQRPIDSKLQQFLSKFSQKKSHNKKRQVKLDPPCIDAVFGETYLSRPDVQQAIHVKPGVTWQICSGLINSDYDRTTDSMVPIYQSLLRNGKRVFIYSGDTDFAVPFTDTEIWTSTDMGLTPTQEWVQWFYDDDEQQIGGFKTEYPGGFTYATVRGSGHMVPQFRPEPAYVMFQRILTGKPL